MSEKQYFDADGSPCTLDALCMRHPAWAANRIRAMREALEKVLDAHNTDAPGWPSKTVGGDDVVYHLDGQRMYIAINAARTALGK